ncbi:GTP cyclohydrolase II [Flavilitoribacter nigricans]|uniref:GTP cyclohydrolase II n=1 Tax=Flavilitoribacter nigricans TaxID=70997 RepID=UPI001EEE5A9A|nr:GTP cyclohydrolase II [Flavilitoribacter nigricans]
MKPIEAIKNNTITIKKQAEAPIPTPWGLFNMIAFSGKSDDWMPHFALVHEHFDPDHPVLTRVHSECITGDLFGSARCECGEQLHKSMELTAQAGGIVLYLRQEGRGIGIINKLKAYNLQDLGDNTIEANEHLHLPIDARSYDVAVQMLQTIGVRQIRLLTNNPAKIEAIEHSPIEMLEIVPLIIDPKPENVEYLRTKKRDMGHLINWPDNKE